MSYLKPGLVHRRRYAPLLSGTMAQIPFAFLLASHTFSAQAELYFNPRFLADDPAARRGSFRF